MEIEESNLKVLEGALKEFEKAKADYERVYSNLFTEESSESMTTFRFDLLKFLSTNIVVKEHR